MPAVPRWLARVLGLPGAVSFRRFERYVREAGLLEDEVRGLSRAELRAAASGLQFRADRTLTSSTPRMLALLREAAGRSVGLRAFDEQLIACCALLSGHAVEMDTGEGKTLVGAITAAGHALAGRRVHVISVNDYLAERDAGWMGGFFGLLGLTVGWVGQHGSQVERRRAYRCAIVYAPVSELGFDVLRDRFAVSDEERVEPVFDVAIVDEADAVMIDEAMVPLVLAGTSDDPAQDFTEATRLVGLLVEGEDFAVDADEATASLTDAGLDRLEGLLGGVNLYAAPHVATLTRLNLALHARTLVHRDVDYLVEGGAIRLINTGRGRVAHLQRWPDGLHAAIEAKEGLAVTAPGVVLDTITIQDLLLGYRSLSGMSGTVVTVAEDFLEFYKLPAGRVERHVPTARVDEPDRVVLTQPEKLAAVTEHVRARHLKGQPVLVGTQSVAESESLAARLVEAGVSATVLNARNDAEEAAIIARAGEHAAVTISTQMSGRGTDIRLGGVDERDRERVVRAGGLAVVGTGRYPSGRLDSQLRGRAGRQGDPGTSAAFASLDDLLVQANAPAHVLAKIQRDGEALSQQQRRTIVDAAQAIAENVRLDRHRATWAYARAIAAQRASVLAERDRVVGSGLGAAVTRYYLDDHWMHHLALLQEIRDGIHLRALAGQKPADEFHRIALREFQGFFDAVRRDTSAFLASLGPDDDGRSLDELGLRRPSATWTYMVTDDPYGSPGDRLARELGKRWRTKVLGIE
ncbi:accessory Sec system translocase SecA2 [soil metagenome]